MELENKWITATQCQKILGIGRTKMWQLRRDHELKYAIHGRKVYILKRSVDEYIQRYAVEIDFTKMKGGSYV